MVSTLLLASPEDVLLSLLSLDRIFICCLWQLVFEGVVGSGYLGDIALDDITYKSGSCRFTPSNAVPPSLQTTTSASMVSSPTTNPVTATSCKSKHLCVVVFLSSVINICFCFPT